MKMLPNFKPLKQSICHFDSLGGTPALPVVRRLEVVLRHEIEQNFGRLVPALLNRVNLAEELSGAFPVALDVLAEALVEHVEERLKHRKFDLNPLLLFLIL